MFTLLIHLTDVWRTGREQGKTEELFVGLWNKHVTFVVNEAKQNYRGFSFHFLEIQAELSWISKSDKFMKNGSASSVSLVSDARGHLLQNLLERFSYCKCQCVGHNIVRRPNRYKSEVFLKTVPRTTPRRYVAMASR